MIKYSGNSLCALLLLACVSCTDGLVQFSGFFGFPYDDVLGSSNSVRAICHLPDGRAYVGGDFETYSTSRVNGIVRLNTNGTVDTSFNTGSGFDKVVLSLAYDSFNDRLYVGGAFDSFNGVLHRRLVALNEDGSTVAGFAAGVINSDIRTIVPDGTGDIYVGGLFTTVGGVLNRRIARLNSDGSRDLAFAIGGGFSDGEVRAIALHPGRGILAGGTFTRYNGGIVFKVLEILTNGTASGTHSYGGSSVSAINGILVTTDGSNKTYVVGDAVARLERLNSNGTIDGTFSVTSGSNEARAIAFGENGSVYVVGDFTVYEGNLSSYIARVTEDGFVDSDFSSGSAFGGGSTTVRAIDISPSEKILAGGRFNRYESTGALDLVRIFQTGQADTSFEVRSGLDASAKVVRRFKSGRVLFGGDFQKFRVSDARRVAQFDNQNLFDSSFSVGLGFNASVDVIEQENVGERLYLAGGFSLFQLATANRIIRLQTNGDRDTGFNIGDGPNTANLNVITVKEDDKVLIGGTFTSFNSTATNRMARLNTDGSVDGGFTSQGFDGGANVQQFLITPTGSHYYVVGDFQTYGASDAQRIVRVTTAGLYDPAFISTDGFNGPATRAAFSQDGSGDVYVIGNFTSYRNTGLSKVARLNSDGSVDAAFNIGTGFDGSPEAIVSDSAGGVYIAGQFGTFNGTSVSNIIRLRSDGSLHPGFQCSTGTRVNAMHLDSDGGLILAGDFNRVNDRTVAFGAEIDANGAIR